MSTSALQVVPPTNPSTSAETDALAVHVVSFITRQCFSSPISVTRSFRSFETALTNSRSRAQIFRSAARRVAFAPSSARAIFVWFLWTLFVCVKIFPLTAAYFTRTKEWWTNGERVSAECGSRVNLERQVTSDIHLFAVVECSSTTCSSIRDCPAPVALVFSALTWTRVDWGAGKSAIFREALTLWGLCWKMRSQSRWQLV